MKAAMQECEFFLAINDDGNFVVCKGDESDAMELLESDEGTGYGARVVKLKVIVPIPKVIEAKAEITEESDDVAINAS